MAGDYHSNIVFSMTAINAGPDQNGQRAASRLQIRTPMGTQGVYAHPKEEQKSAQPAEFDEFLYD